MHANRGETRGPDELEIGAALHGARNAADVGEQIDRDRVGETACEDDIGDDHPATRTEDAGDLTKDDRLVGHEVDDAVAGDGVHGRIVDRKRLKPAVPEVDLTVSSLGRIDASPLQHLGGHVDADDPASVADVPRRKEGVDAGARAEVEDRLARHEIEKVDRSPAAKTEVGSLRKLLEVGGLITDLRGRSGRGSAASGRFPGGDPSISLADLVDDLPGVVGKRGLDVVHGALLRGREL